MDAGYIEIEDHVPQGALEYVEIPGEEFVLKDE
jgi:hypothetical protein